MSATAAAWIVIAFAMVAANLPWLSERILFVREAPEGKRAIWRWLEWLLLYFVIGGLALGVEKKLNGGISGQGWEFYAITACLFLVFALPGFIYKYDLKHHLARR